MVVRPAKRSDFDRVAGIYRAGYGEVKDNPNFGDYLRLKKPTHSTEEKWKKNIYNDIKNGDFVYLVAEERGKILGFCYASKKDVPDSEMSHIGSVGIRVVKNYRGKGIGTQLLKKLIEKCKGKFDILEINVLRNNKKAIKLYKKFNFKTWGIAPNYVKRGKRYIDMEYLCLKL